jgi:TPP-dependent pyruvate/acetoin dehydrogenase alpha subunit
LKQAIRPELKQVAVELNLERVPNGTLSFWQIDVLGRVGLSETKQHENPLVPNKKLRQIYVAMVEARALDEHIAGLKTGKGQRRLESTRGQEACRVSTSVDLGPGDLVSDSQVGVVTDLIAGTKVSSLLKRVAEFSSAKKAGATRTGVSQRVLPWIEGVDEQLKMALGAALAFKTLGQKNIVVAYVRHGEAGKGTWREVLGLASKLELPVIFVVMPAKKAKLKGASGLREKARRWGVPGISVDAGDAVALYRVAQESIGRTRAGDGPVLIECVEYRAEGRNALVDPLVQMKDFLLGRKVCTEAWLKGAGDRLRRKIATIRK